MRFGFQISVAGGLDEIVKRALHLSCETIQIFSRNPRAWENRPLAFREAAEFRKALAEAKISPLVIHMPYLPNLGTPVREIYQKSVESLKIELGRAESLGADFVVIHVGSRKDATAAQGLDNVSRGLNEALSDAGDGAMVLLENTAGQGSQIGHKFSEIGRILKAIKKKERVGVCLDVAHAFQAGYPLATARGLAKTLAEFEEEIGLEKLFLLHFNDSKTPCGSKVDRHQHIGEGEIGREGFSRIIHHPRLKQLPAIMETPREDESDDFRNMKIVKRLNEDTT